MLTQRGEYRYHLFLVTTYQLHDGTSLGIFDHYSVHHLVVVDLIAALSVAVYLFHVTCHMDCVVWVQKLKIHS